MAKCLKCGNFFIGGSMISDYCRVCLKKYPELKPRAASCALPKCIHYEPYGKINLLTVFVPCQWNNGSHCKLLKKRLVIPIINCPKHETKEVREE